VIKATVLLAAALCAMRAFRRRSAAERHVVWVAILLASAVLPLLDGLVPRWQPEVVRRAAAVLPLLGTDIENDARVDGDVVVRAEAMESAPATRLLFIAWTCGSALVLLSMARGRWRLHQYLRHAAVVDDPEWQTLTRDVSTRLGQSRAILLLRSVDVSVPLTWGLMAPRVLVPAAADAWPDERRRVVLAHELAHVGRGDWIVQLAARLVCALYWFNPLFWIAARAMAVESERACDDAVLGLDIDRGAYAVHLYEVARASIAGPATTVALGMAGASRLEHRIRSLLDERASRRGATRLFVILVACALLALSVPLAALRFPTTAASVDVRTLGLPGTPDATAALSFPSVVAAIREVRAIPDVVGGNAIAPPEVVEYSAPPLYSDEARRRRVEGSVTLAVRVDASGRAEVLGVVNGLGFGLDENARLAVERWQFRPARRAGHAVDSITTLDVAFTLANDALNEVIANDMATRVGPGVTPPRVVRRVAVPRLAHAPSGRDAAVVLDIVLLEDGRPRVVRIARSLDAEADRVAIRTFEQWRFSPARQDGVPVKVRMNAEIRFSPRS
jgi:TonB family protein